MILNIRGTSGSGKTTVARSLMERFPVRTPLAGDAGKLTRPEAYQLTGPGLPTTYLIGSYENTCGGCDAIPTQDEICRRVRKYAPLGNVVFEGLLMSNIFGRYAALSRELKQYGYIHAFIDTPLEVCLERVNARRQARGQMEPVDPKNTTAKYTQTRQCYEKMKREPDLDARLLPHQSANDTAWAWLTGLNVTVATTSVLEALLG